MKRTPLNTFQEKINNYRSFHTISFKTADPVAPILDSHPQFTSKLVPKPF